MASSIVVASLTVAASALGARSFIRAWQAFKTRPVIPRTRNFYHGGFEQVMTRREAALILGVRERAAMENIKEVYLKVMKANHPDQGGSKYLVQKIAEAKDIMVGRQGGSSSAF